MMRASDSFAPLRSIAVACAALCLLPAAQAQAPTLATPAQQMFDFDVNLDKRPIGTHRFIVSRQADGATRIQSNASFDVRFLGIAAYRYRHQATEQWQGDCLSAIDAATNDNGRSLRVSGSQREGRFQLEQPANTALPACLSAYAYWNRDLLLRQRALLNPQTGKLDELRVESLGRQTLELKGQAIPVERYRLHAAQNVIELWYSLRGEWLQLESTTGSRSLIYRLRAAP
jgi:hypothetical protein